jgi:hypothetical protein
MRYDVLILNNGVPYPIGDALKETAAFFASRSPVETRFTQRSITPTRSFKLTAFDVLGPSGEMLAGLDGMRTLMKEEGVPGKLYNAIVFLYDVSRVEYGPFAREQLRHWTHWEPWEGANVVQIGTSPEWGEKDLVRVLTHELLHCFHSNARRNGAMTNDTMDLYDQEMDTYSMTGNRARNLGELIVRNAWREVVSQPYLTEIILGFWRRLDTLQAMWKAMNEERLTVLLLAIRRHEGWKKGSRSQRNNNPGNARFSRSGYRAIYGTVGEDREGVSSDQSGYAIFRDYATGELYLRNLLKTIINGTSATYNREAQKLGLKNSSELTIEQLFAIYAPSSDHNDPKRYAEVVAAELKVDPSARISTIFKTA